MGDVVVGNDRNGRDSAGEGKEGREPLMLRG